MIVPRESEALQENALGGVGTALVVGGVAALAYFLFLKPAKAAKAATAPAACAIDPAKLDRWGEARGFPIELLPRATPPTMEEFLASSLASLIAAGEQAVVVLQDGTFWYYIKEPASTGRADNLRADYCSFPDAPPPQVPPPEPPQPGTAQGLGQQTQPQAAAIDYGARQFYAWNSRRQEWDLIGTYVDALPGYIGAFFGTTGTVSSDLEQFLGGASLYAERWLVEVQWIYTPDSYTPPNLPRRWRHYNTSHIEPPAANRDPYGTRHN